MSRSLLRAGVQALLLSWRAAPVVAVGQLISTVAAGLLPVGVAVSTRLMLDSLSAHESDGALWGALLAALAGFTMLVVQQVGAYLGGLQSARLAELTERQISERLCGFVGLRYFESPRFRDKMSLASEAAQDAPGTVSGFALQLVQTLTSLGGFIGVLLVVWPPIVPLLAVAVVPAVVGQWRLSRHEVAAAEASAGHMRENGFLRFTIAERRAAQEIRIYGLGGLFVERIAGALRSANTHNLSVGRRRMRFQIAIGVVSAGSTLIATVVAVRSALDGRLTLGDVTVFAAAATTLYASVLLLIGSAGSAVAAVTLFRHYLDVMQAPPDLPTADRPAMPLHDAIEFRDVWFRYDETGPWVLRGVSFRLDAGTSLGLVGLNGSGKSTIVKLLCRMYDPQRGSITWDGVPLSELDPAALRRHIGCAFQDFVTFDATFGDNIGFGDLDRLGDVDAIADAARKVGLHDMAMGLPRGYQTRMSREFVDPDDPESETGVDLSGGQRQRTAIARSLMRADASLWILDEPTAALDPEAEQEIHGLLRTHSEGRTNVLVSHRLSAVRDADSIIVLERGEIIEHGTHDGLLESRGRYHELFTTQARGYVSDVPVGAWASVPELETLGQDVLP